MKRNKYLILTVLWMAVIFFFSSQNAEASSLNNSFIVELFGRLGIDLMKLLPGIDIHYIIRKAAHLTEYFILGMLLYKACKTYLYNGYGVISVITGFLYACTDEIHQYFVPGRGPAFKDVLIDTSGVILGVCLLWVLHGRRTARYGNIRKSA